MESGSVCNAGRTQASNFSLLLHHQKAPRASESVDTLFLSVPSSSLGESLLTSITTTHPGSQSMMSFEDVQMKRGFSESFFHRFDHDDNGRHVDLDEYFHQTEKKRRLTCDQVLFLEKSFEVENKLEAERKIQLAKDSGLQPRQVAIWFQNRRARWKTKQLEKDYGALQASYNSLKVGYETLLKEKDKLNAEVLQMTENLLGREKEDTKKSQGSPLKHLSASEGEGSKVSALACKHEDINSAKSDLSDSDSPHCPDGGHSSFLEPCDSPHVFEADQQSDLSQDEEGNLSKDLFPIPPYVFPKLEDIVFSNPPESSCNFSFPVEDHAIWSWSF